MFDNIATYLQEQRAERAASYHCLALVEKQLALGLGLSLDGFRVPEGWRARPFEGAECRISHPRTGKHVCDQPGER